MDNINSKDGDEVTRAMNQSTHMKPVPQTYPTIQGLGHTNLKEEVLEMLQTAYEEMDEEGATIDHQTLAALAGALICEAGKGRQAPWHMWDIIMDSDAQRLTESNTTIAQQKAESEA